jgi:hypothetical protein
MNRLREEMKVIPRAAWALAMVLAAGVAGVFWITVVATGQAHLPEMLLLILIPAIFSVYILVIGYIVGDARRRGMPVLLWALLAIFIPSAIGIILYFILRRPLLRACPRCGVPADAAYTFCSSCGATLGKTCPSCHNSVESGWAHCPRCGVPLSPA